VTVVSHSYGDYGRAAANQLIKSKACFNRDTNLVERAACKSDIQGAAAEHVTSLVPVMKKSYPSTLTFIAICSLCQTVQGYIFTFL